MKTIKFLKTALILLTATALSACGGGGGGGSSTPPAPYNTAAHDALAQQFITEATAEGLGYTLVKQDTQQQGYIVVQTSSGVIEAFNVDAWTPGTPVSSVAPAYTGLAPAGGNTYSVYVSSGYEDYEWVSSGYYDANGNYVDTSSYQDMGWVDTSSYLTFEVTQPTTKDLQKLAAFKQQHSISASAVKVQQKFGLSLERATQVAKLAIQAKNTPKMSNDDYDSLSQQLLGVPVAKLDSAISKTASGDASANSEVDDIIGQAAQTNGVGPEQARALLNTLTSGTGKN